MQIKVMLQNVWLYLMPSQWFAFYSICTGSQHSSNTGKQMIYLHFKHDNWRGSMTSQMELDKLFVQRAAKRFFYYISSDRYEGLN